MTDDREDLVSEIQRLREAIHRLELFAMCLLVLVFVLIVPFTSTVYEIMKDLTRLWAAA
jgi:hypothetical protein